MWQIQTMFLILRKFLSTKINHLPCWWGSVAVTWQKGRKGLKVSAHCWQWLVATALTGGHADTSQGTIWHSGLCFSTPHQPDCSCSLVKNSHPPTVTYKKQWEMSAKSPFTSEGQYKFVLSNKEAWRVLHAYLQGSGVRVQNKLLFLLPKVKFSIIPVKHGRMDPGSIPGGVTGDFFRCTPPRTVCPVFHSASESEYQGFILE